VIRVDRDADHADEGSMHTDDTTNVLAPLSIVIDEERDTDRGWAYALTLSWKSRGTTEHEVTLSWLDHDQLTGGAMPPSRLVERVVEIAASAMGVDELPARFDVSSMRRAIPEFERLVGRSGH
tara:strand:- start:10583 stop:10951 length:369 start_codon:yes stop_codon:yes gene_type:complete